MGPDFGPLAAPCRPPHEGRHDHFVHKLGKLAHTRDGKAILLTNSLKRGNLPAEGTFWVLERHNERDPAKTIIPMDTPGGMFRGVPSSSKDSAARVGVN